MTLGGVIFAGGGTGGHIFPAIAIEEQLDGGPARRAGRTSSATDQSSGQCSTPQQNNKGGQLPATQQRDKGGWLPAALSPPPFPTGEVAESPSLEGVRCGCRGCCPEQPRSHNPRIPTAYLCSTRPIDRAILEPRHANFTPIPAAPFSAKPKALLHFLRAWPNAVRACRETIRTQYTAWNINPNQCALVATGGFVCAPAATAAGQLGLSVVLLNLDAVPGKAARLLARKADQIFTTYPAFGITPVGPIVRNQARSTAPPETCREHFGLDPDKPTLVISGASQGATSINAFILTLARESPEIFEGWQILHQAGPDRAPAVEAEYRTLSVQAKVVGLVSEVGRMWGAATLALARSGAGTVAELWANAVPTLFMPYPYHRDEHQKHNARPMVDAGLASILTDHIDPARNIAAHRQVMADRLKSPKFANIGQNFAQPPDGAAEIATQLRNK